MLQDEIRKLLKNTKPADRIEIVLRLDDAFRTMRPDENTDGVVFTAGRFSDAEPLWLTSEVQLYLQNTYGMKTKRSDVKMIMRWVAESLEEEAAS